MRILLGAGKDRSDEFGCTRYNLILLSMIFLCSGRTPHRHARYSSMSSCFLRASSAATSFLRCF